MCETRNLYLFVLQVLGLLGLLALILWLSLRPKQPSYTILDFSIQTANNQNLSSESVSYILEIENPNKDSSIYHDDIFLTFIYGQETAGEDRIPSFYQGRHKTRPILTHVKANPALWKAFSNTISNATAELKVVLLSRIRYKTWGHKSKHRGINLQGRLIVGSDGKISGKKKKIKLHQASKKWGLRTTCKTSKNKC